MTAFRRHWGFALFSALSAFGLMRLLGQHVHGHYLVFTDAARAFAEGRNPYGTDFGTGVGDYFYSPACALYLFRPFTWLAERQGLVAYMLLSWGAFVLGARRALEAFSRPVWGAEPPPALAQLFWIGVAPQLYGGILASKLEILMTGVLFFSAALIAERRWLILSGVLAAAITNWKFQPLPVMGLLAVAWFTGASGLPWRQRLKWPLAFGAGLGLFYVLPIFELGYGRFVRDQEIWLTSFSAFVHDSYLNFENVFALVNHVFGFAFSYRETQLVTGAVGAALVLNLIAWIRWIHPEPAWSWVTLLALGSGTMVMTAFSPLGQNNAMILYAPLVLAALLRVATSDKSKGLLIIFGGFWFLATFSYSDLTPIVIREQMRYLCAKAGACFGLGVVLIASYWRVEWMRMLNEQRKKLKPNRTFFCALLAASALASLTRCGPNGNMNSISQDEVFPQYNLSYDDASKAVLASVVFTQGNALGPRLTLSGGASIQLSDGTAFQTQISEPDQHVFYQALLGTGNAGDTSKSYVFQFKNSSGDEYDNTLSFNGLINVKAVGTSGDPNSNTLSLNAASSSSNSVTWDVSSALKTGEYVEVRIRQVGGKGAVAIHREVVTPSQAPQANVAAAELSALTPGQGLVRVCRVYQTVPAQHAKAGGLQTVSACSSESPVTLTQTP